MKKNRLLIYLFLFVTAVITFTTYGRSEVENFPEEKVTGYQQDIRIGVTDILNRIPIEQIEKEKDISKDQSSVLVEKTYRILSSYTELQAIASTFLDMSELGLITQSILENIYLSLTQLEDLRGNNTKLTEGQVDYIAEVYRFLADVHNRDAYNMKLEDSLGEMEKVAMKYPNLSHRMEGFD